MMNLRHTGQFCVFTLTLLSLFAQFKQATATEYPQVEPVYSARFDDTHVIIDVKSHGCTRPEHFSIQAKGKPGYEFSKIRIVRDRPDLCKAAPRIIRVYLELPGALAALNEPYKLENLFYTSNNITHNL